MARLASPDHHCRSLPLSPSADIFVYCLLCDEMQICGAIEVKSTIIIIIIVNKEMKNIYILHWNRWIRLSKDFCFLNFQFFDPLPHHRRSIDRSIFNTFRRVSQFALLRNPVYNYYSTICKILVLRSGWTQVNTTIRAIQACLTHRERRRERFHFSVKCWSLAIFNRSAVIDCTYYYM